MTAYDWVRALNGVGFAVDAAAFGLIWFFIPRTYGEMTARQRKVYTFRRITLFGCMLICATLSYGSFESITQHIAYGLRIWGGTFSTVWVSVGLLPWTWITVRDARKQARNAVSQ